MSVFEFIVQVVQAISMALRFDPDTFSVMQTWPLPNLVLVTVVLLCGASLLLGQSVILFLNRVPPQRFVLSLMLNGILFGVSLMLWGAAIWLIGVVIFGATPVRGTLLWIMCLSSAPYIFGFLVLIPWAGEFIGRLLSAWSLLIAIVGVRLVYGTSLWTALLCVGLGWIVIQLAQATIGKPIIWLRDWLWRKVVGDKKHRRAGEILEAFMSDQSLLEALRERRHL